MKFLTKHEAEALAVARGYRIDVDEALESCKDFYSFAFPSHRTGMAVLAQQMTDLLDDFDSALFLVTEWGIWPASEDRNLFDRFRQALGLNAAFPDYVGQLFDSADAKDLATFLHLIIAFSWGGFLFLVGENDRKLGIFISHDEWARIWFLEGDEARVAELVLTFAPEEPEGTTH